MGLVAILATQVARVRHEKINRFNGKIFVRGQLLHHLQKSREIERHGREPLSGLNKSGAIISGAFSGMSRNYRRNNRYRRCTEQRIDRYRSLHKIRSSILDTFPLSHHHVEPYSCQAELSTC